MTPYNRHKGLALQIVLLVGLMTWLPSRLIAQAPSLISYQGMLMHANGEPAVRETLTLRLSLMKGVPDGATVYTERHSITTTRNGLFHLLLGNGTTNESLSAIDWSEGPYFMKSEVDTTGATDYQIVSSDELKSVPYALYTNQTHHSQQTQEVPRVAHADEARHIDGLADSLRPIHLSWDTMTSLMTDYIDSAIGQAAAMVDTWMSDEGVPFGGVKGVFSVAAGRQVFFAKGNLQYNDSSRTFRFADNQYNVITYTNNRVSEEDRNRWIDLFGWGTSGWSGSGSVYYEPFSWQTNDSLADGGIYGPQADADLRGPYANADWGQHNAIANGGNRAGQWRLLTKDEWYYLLFRRQSTDIGIIRNARFARAMVNSTYGLIIFPDEYVHPADATLPENINDINSYSFPQYSILTWKRLERCGCVFLPINIYRDQLSTVTYQSYYWSSSSASSTKAYALWLSRNSSLNPYSNLIYKQSTDRGIGGYVRLVHDKQ